MRLSVLFLSVLALAAIVTSMAAWGIMYGTAYDRVSSMSSGFTALTQEGFEQFGAFVSDLLWGNAALVDAILDAQRRAGVNRTEETKAQLTQIVNVLVNFSSNLTDQTLVETARVMNSYGSLVDGIVGAFQSTSGLLSQEIRRNLLLAVTFSTNALTAPTAIAVQRFGRLVGAGTLALSRSPTADVGPEDCAILDAMCDIAGVLSPFSFTVTSATGRSYGCSTPRGAWVSYTAVRGGAYGEYRLRWAPYNSSVPDDARRIMKQRCLLESPDTEVVGLNCSVPQCGADQRRTEWYQANVNCSTCDFASQVYNSSGAARLHTTLPLFNSSASPPTLVGVADVSASLADTRALLPADNTLFGMFGLPKLALLLNDRNLTVLSTNTRQCDVNEPAPGDPQMPPSSGFRACDPGLLAVAQYTAANGNPWTSLSLDRPDVLWNISPLQQTATMSYYVVVGVDKVIVDTYIGIFQGIHSVLPMIVAQLQNQTAKTVAATRAYATTLGEQNIEDTQSMQDSYLTEFAALVNASRTTMATSQERSKAQAQAIKVSQTVAAEAKKQEALSAMAVTAGWMVAVVCALLLTVLALSAWGTNHVASALNSIIGLMEDVADLKVENLAVPQGSRLQEVSRIQSAFQVMVLRLAEYKSYIPAGVFEKVNRGIDLVEDHSDTDGDTTDPEKPPVHHGSNNQGVLNVLPSGRQHSSRPSQSSSGGAGPSPHDRPAPPPGHRRGATRPVAVLSLSLVRFMDALLAHGEGLPKSLFNDYLSRVHEVVSMGRGNVDFLAGDQIVVTFNAHVPCSDPPGAATAAAIDLQQRLLQQFGDRLRFHIVISFGQVFASTVGYSRFKYMATIGSPMKVATALSSRIESIDNGTIIADATVQERMKYSYEFRPMELVNLPCLKSFAQDMPTSHRIFMLKKEKAMQEDEWLYQVENSEECTDWAKTFEQLVAAPSVPEAQSYLKQYLVGNPLDDVALRLQDRLVLWAPGLGIPM